MKRRPEASVGGVIELRKIADQDADSLVSRRKAKRLGAVSASDCPVLRESLGARAR